MTKTDSITDPRLKKHGELLAKALSCNGGDRSYAQWKASATAEFVELANRAERMTLLGIDLRGDLNIVYRIEMPVPRWPRGSELQIGESAVFQVIYKDEWRTEPPAGWEPLGLLQPLDVFHPNCRPALRGALCLGRIPAGTPPTELALLGYYLVALQDYTLDEHDPEGVLNSQACEYFRSQSQYLPLTKAGLFDSWTPQELDHAHRR